MSDGGTSHDPHEQSVGDPQDGMMRLATEGGREIWLDLSTGKEVARPAAVSRTQENAVYPPESPLLDTVTEAVEANGWRHIRLDERVIAFPIHGHRAAYDALVIANDEFHYVTTYCTFGPRVPDDRRAAVAEAIGRANFGIVVGNFEMDFSDGELRFRVGAGVEGGTLSVEMARNMFSLAIYMCDRYHDALMRVMFAGQAPADAIQRAEAA